MMTGTGNRARVLYLGSYLDEKIVAERGLRSQNAAGSNRMLRLSHALYSVGYRPIVLSPATSLLACKKGGPILQPARVGRHKGTMIIFAPALNLMGLNVATTLIFQFMVIINLMRRPLVGAIVYNFSPSLVFLSAWLALKSNFRVINNIEDVSVPALSDWSCYTEVRPVQQLIFWVCMNLISRMVDAYVVPTKRFLDFLPTKKPFLVVTGCIEIPQTERDLREPSPLRILYAGKIAREHGIVQFVEALITLDASPEAERIQVDISGVGPMSDWVAKNLTKLEVLETKQHGFVSKEAYSNLLNDAHICVALQDPEGRFSKFKTPSKIYEFLGHGKAVIGTDVGDISDLPNDIGIVLDKLEAENIVVHISHLSKDPLQVAVLSQNALRYAIENFSYRNVGVRLERLFNKEHL